MTEQRERADCAVRALTDGTAMPYEQAHALFEDAGRKRSQRTKTKTTRKVLREFGRKQILKYGVTIARFVRLHPEGRYIVRVRGHLLAITDGVPSDATPLGRRILEYWRMYA